MEGDHNDSQSLLEALDMALKIFGAEASEALKFHLKNRMPGFEQGLMTLEDLESALSDLLGVGAEIVMSAVRQHLRPPSTAGGRNETSSVTG